MKDISQAAPAPLLSIRQAWHAAPSTGVPVLPISSLPAVISPPVLAADSDSAVGSLPLEDSVGLAVAIVGSEALLSAAVVSSKPVAIVVLMPSSVASDDALLPCELLSSPGMRHSPSLQTNPARHMPSMHAASGSIGSA